MIDWLIVQWCYKCRIDNDKIYPILFNQGNTSSKNTGPSHLLDGAYAYIEATSMAKGSKAILSNVDLTLRTPGEVMNIRDKKLSNFNW